MIRLVTCDIDGTLLHGTETVIDAETLGEIRRLREKGILFCPASGRQYHSLRRLFRPVADELAFICENGSVVFGPGSPGPVWGKVPLDRTEAIRLCRDIMTQPGCVINASGENTCYACNCDEEFLRHMREDVGNITEVVDDPEDIPEEIIKVSAFCRGGADAAIGYFKERWEAAFQVAVAGEQWIDFTLADKGSGLEIVCRAMGVRPEEVISFGDNYNDIPILSMVGRPYIMENAAEELREMFPNHCRRVAEVLKTL